MRMVTVPGVKDVEVYVPGRLSTYIIFTMDIEQEHKRGISSLIKTVVRIGDWR